MKDFDDIMSSWRQQQVRPLEVEKARALERTLRAEAAQRGRLLKLVLVTTLAGLVLFQVFSVLNFVVGTRPTGFLKWAYVAVQQSCNLVFTLWLWRRLMSHRRLQREAAQRSTDSVRSQIELSLAMTREQLRDYRTARWAGPFVCLIPLLNVAVDAIYGGVPGHELRFRAVLFVVTAAVANKYVQHRIRQVLEPREHELGKLLVQLDDPTASSD